MKLPGSAIIFAFVLVLMGCPKNQGRVPEVLAKRVINYEVAKFDESVSDYGKSANVQAKGQIRNDIIFRLKRNIDAFYHDFERDLYYHRASTGVFADFTELAAAAATGITNGERAKNILAISLTAFKGGRKSYDEHFFRERTTEILISKMRSSRSKIEGEINKRMAVDALSYSLEESLGDLIRYFYAGTLQNALQELAQQTGKEADDEKRKATEEADRRISPEIQAEFDDSANLRTALRQLQNDIASGDAAKVSAAQARLKIALTKFGVTSGANDSAQALLDKLVASLRKAQSTGGAIALGTLTIKQVVEALQP